MNEKSKLMLFLIMFWWKGKGVGMPPGYKKIDRAPAVLNLGKYASPLWGGEKPMLLKKENIQGGAVNRGLKCFFFNE